MIILHGFGPLFGLPDASPYVMKTETLLRIAGLEYRKVPGDREKAPKGKLPFIDDDGTLVADSTFIRAHIETTRGIDLDAGLTVRQRAEAWAVERMLEDHLTWAMVHERWLDEDNFRRGPAQFFRHAPPTARAGIEADVKAKITNALQAQGMGRHSAAERVFLAERSLSALSVLLGDKPFMMGEQPSGLDAYAFAILAGLTSPTFDGPNRRAAESFGNFRPYLHRMAARYYPDHVWWWDQPTV